MESMQNIIESLNTSAIGWALLHTIWQGLIIYLALRLIFLVVNPKAANVKYWLGYSALVIQVLWFGITLVNGLGNTISGGATSGNSSVHLFMPAGDYNSLWQLFLGFLNQQAPWVFVVWVGGIVLLGIRFLGSLIYVHQLTHKNLIAVDKHLESFFNMLKERLQVPGNVRIFLSEKVSLPVAAGILKPVVLVPIGFVNGLSQQQVETILLHELTHIKRNDYVLNLIQAIVEIILFFNPFTLLISNQIRKERERACDDYVVRFSNRLDYAQALIAAQEWTENKTLAIGLHKGKSELYNRIQRIMGKVSLERERKSFRKLIAYAFVLGSIAISLAFSIKEEVQSQEKEIARQPEVSQQEQTSQQLQLPQPPQELVNSKTEENMEEIEEPDRQIENLAALSPQGLEELAMLSSLAPLDTPELVVGDLRKLLEEIMANREEWLKSMEESQAKLQEALSAMDLKQLDEFPDLKEELKLVEAFELQRAMDFEALEKNMMKTREMLEKLELEKRTKESLKIMEEEMARAQEEMRAMEEEVREMELNMKKAVTEIKEQAVKDGYLKSTKGEVSIDFEEDGIYINHQKVKKEHEKKYRDIHKKYFPNDRPTFHIRDN